MGSFKLQRNKFAEFVYDQFSPMPESARDDIARIADAQERPLFDALNPADPTVERLAKEITTQEFLTSGDGQRLSARIVNRDAAHSDGSRQLLVINNGFDEYIENSDSQSRLFSFARAFGNWVIVNVNNKSHGLSSGYTKPQRDGMFKYGDLSEVGAEGWDALERWIAATGVSFDRIALFGRSYGQRVGDEIALASQQAGGKHRIDHVIGTDWKGVTHDRFGPHKDFFGFEGAAAGVYRRGWEKGYLSAFETLLAELGYGQQPEKGNVFFSPFAYNRLATSTRNIWRTVLGFGTGYTTARTLIENGGQKLDIVGNSSKLGAPVLKKSLQEQMRDETGGRTFALALSQGDAHAAGGELAWQPLVAKVVSEGLEHMQTGTLDTSRPLRFSYADVQAGRTLDFGVDPL